MFPGGPGFAAKYMRGDAELFSGALRTFLIDPHGSGGSSVPEDPADYSPEGHARFYDEVRTALGLSRVVVFGHSFGATTALTYAAMFPDAVQACIAVSPYGIGTDQDEGAAADEMTAMLKRHEGAPWYPEAEAAWEGWTDRVLATDDPDEVASMMAAVIPLYTAHPDRPEVWAGLEDFRGVVEVDLAAVKAWESGLYQGIDLRPLLGKVRAPTLVVAGEMDLICGPAQAVPITQALADATLTLIPDCGHMPTIESPDAFKAAVVDWLSAH